jgi:hypothetical protein
VIASFATIELRRYTLRAGMREQLIALFEREFIESQEACGMTPIGHYRDLDDDNSFVWFRGFERFEGRRAALEAFYVHSEAWRAYRDEANATMLDSDNVLLLRAARGGSGFDLRGLRRPQPEEVPSPSYVAASIRMSAAPVTESIVADFETRVFPKLRSFGRVAYFVTEERPNDFPRLPVREGEWAFVVIGVCADQASLDAWARLFRQEGYETMRLVPAARSLFR